MGIYSAISHTSQQRILHKSLIVTLPDEATQYFEGRKTHFQILDIFYKDGVAQNVDNPKFVRNGKNTLRYLLKKDIIYQFSCEYVVIGNGSIDVNNANVAVDAYIIKYNSGISKQTSTPNVYTFNMTNPTKYSETHAYYETAGLHILELNDVVEIKPSEHFLVVYKLSAPDVIKVASAPGVNNVDNFTKESGFYSFDSNTWYTQHTNQYCNNLAIRAYTVSETNKELKSINAALKDNVSFIEGNTITNDKINVYASTTSTLYDETTINNENVELNSNDFSIVGDAKLKGGNNTIVLSYTLEDVTKTCELNVYATPHVHSYTSQITKEPTCETLGERTYTCSSCKNVYTESIDAKGHSYTSSITRQPTCALEGIKTYTCKNCNNVYTETIEKTQDHSYESSVTKQPTCKEAGIRTYTCSICKKTYTESINKTQDHSYESSVTKQPTCKEEGIKIYTCKICGNSYTKTIERTQDHSYEPQVVKEATCEEDGIRTYTCKICNKSFDEVINKMGHNYTSQIAKNPTCEEAGERTYTCGNCGDAYTESIDKKDHTYASQVTKEPTRKDEGERTYTCSSCGDTYKEPIEKLVVIENQIENIVVTNDKTTMNILLSKGNKLIRKELAKEKIDGKFYKATTTNKKIATINSKGNIVAKGPGTCVIEVQKANRKYVCNIEVTAPIFKEKNYIINKGETINLDFSGTALKVEYSIPTKQQKYATIDDAGNVIGLEKGKVTVTAIVFGTKYKAKVTVK